MKRKITEPSINPHFFVGLWWYSRMDAGFRLHKLYGQCDSRGKRWIARIRARVLEVK